VRLSSVRNRLFVVIAGMAVLASASIGAVYLATESERLAVRTEARAVAELYDLTARLSNAIRDQEAAVDDYLLSGTTGAVVRYRNAVEDELRINERMHVDVVEFPDVEALLAAVARETGAWRAAFAEPSIDAVVRGSKTDIQRMTELASTDQEPTVAGVGTLISRLTEAESDAAVRDDALTRTRAAAGAVGIGLMLLASVASLILTRRWVTKPLGRLLTDSAGCRSRR
jgi:hypothetical protein